MSVVPASIITPIREEFLASLPDRKDAHPLGCHNPRIPDGIVFDRIILALVSGMGYERVADEACSATTIRRRRDEWIEASVIGHLILAVLAAYDQMVGLHLEELAADGCITKAPSGGDCAGRNPEPGTWALSCCCCCCQLGEADVQDEVSEPQIQDSAAGPVHDERQQDDGEDDDHQPEEEHDNSGDGVPGYSSRSSHGLQLPGAARIIRNGR